MQSLVNHFVFQQDSALCRARATVELLCEETLIFVAPTCGL